jgi:hypothetical protein
MSSSAFRNPAIIALVILAVPFWVQGCGTGGMKDRGYTAENEPQGDTDPQGARPLSSASTQQGFIEYVGDSDWYQLEIPQDVDTVRFELSNQALQSDVDLSLSVIGDDGVTILGGRYDPNGGDGLTQVTLELTVADLPHCYAVIRDHLGNDADPVNPYFLRVTLSSGPGDGNNSPESATPVECGTVVQDAMQALSDVDWFRVDMAPGADILAYTLSMLPGSPDLVLTLYESSGTTAIVSLSDPDGQNGPTILGRNVHLTESGYYYFSVRDSLDDDADAGLLYDLSVQCVADPDANEPNGNFDTPAQNMANATSLPLDAPVTGYIAYQGDEDWYRLNMPQDGLLNLAIQTSAGGMPVDLVCTLLGSDGHSVENEFVVEAGIDPTDFSLRVALPSGTHYLRVRDDGDDGADLDNAYSVRASFEPDPDPNEPNGNFETEQQNRNHATMLMLGVPELGYIGSNSDQDWFQVFVATPGVYHISLTNAAATEVDLSMSLYRPDLNGLNMILTRSEEDRDGSDGPTDIQAQLYLFEADTYYIVVQDLYNNDTDLEEPYQIEVNAVALPPGSNEPDEDRSEYVTILSGQLVQGFIEFEGDRDWYGIDIQGEMDVLVEIWNDTPSPVEFIWFMYEPDSTRVFASAGDSTESDANLIHIVTGDNEEFWVGEENAGLYMFKLSDFNRNDWDTAVPYNFRVTLTPRAP